MAHKPHKETGIFINEVSSHQRRYHKVLELTHSTTKAAGVMLLGGTPKYPLGLAQRTQRCRWPTSSMMCLWPFSSCWSGWKSSTK